jgi:hypothetical protein
MTIWQPSQEFPHGLGNTWPLVVRNFPIVICWTHKSANTTMLKWFLYHTQLLGRATAEYPDRLHLFWHAYASAQPDYAEQCFRALAGPVRKLTVKVIRDPAHRAVSGFLHFVRDPKAGFRDTWADFIAWKRATGRSAEATATFIDFLQFILDTRDAGKPVDLHARPQWNPAQDPYVRLHIPLEDLSSHLHRLEHLCGLRTSPLDRLSRSPHHSPPAKGRPWPPHASSLPLDKKRLCTLGAPDGGALLDDVTLPLIHDAFAADYAAYAAFYGNPSHQAESTDECRANGRTFGQAA